jgi:hypothetical protein
MFGYVNSLGLLILAVIECHDGDLSARFSGHGLVLAVVTSMVSSLVVYQVATFLSN